MTFDCRLYDRMAGSWWDEHGFLHALTALNPSRFLRRRRRGQISFYEAFRQMKLGESLHVGVQYLGYARKAP